MGERGYGLSMGALRWARIPRPTLSGPAAAVLLCLADHANERGECWPAVSTVAAEMSMSMSTVRRALRELEREALLATRRTGRGNFYMLPAAVLVAGLTDQSGHSDRSERSEGPIRAVRGTAKASRSERKPKRGARTVPAGNGGTRAGERPAAAAYREPEPDDKPGPIEVDAGALELARGWLQSRDRPADADVRRPREPKTLSGGARG